jgi:Tfp pilus assembly protein PilN
MISQLWGAVVVIVLGYALGFYFQSRSIAHLDKRIDDLRAELNHRFDDLRAALNHRFDDLKDWIRSEVKRLEDRIEHVEHPIIKG